MKLLRKDILVKPKTKVEVTNSLIYTKESVNDSDIQFFEVISIADAVTMVKVGDIIGCSWRNMTPPMIMELDGTDVKVGITDEDKIEFIYE